MKLFSRLFFAGNPSDCRTELLPEVSVAINVVSQHLNALTPTAYSSWWKRFKAWWHQLGSGQRNPVRIKNLEKVLAHLQVLQHFLDNEAIKFSSGTSQILSGQLDQLKVPKEISFNQAWEIADKLEAELLRIGDANYIKGVWLSWPRSRVPDAVRDLVVKQDDDLSDTSATGVLNTLVRPWLMEDQRDLVQEYRRDRAMITMRRSYLNIMAIALLVLDLAFCWFFITVQSAAPPSVSATSIGVDATGAPNTLGTPAPGATPAATAVPDSVAADTDQQAAASGNPEGLGTTWPGLLLIIATGAIGSVLARATRLSQQRLPTAAVTGKDQEMPLGIRSLMSTWSVFWAQVMLGATAALIAYLVFSSGLLNIEGLDVQTPETLAVLSFIAGFSEPFFLDVVGRISGRVV